MGTTKQRNIKNRIYYFYDDMVNIKDFDPNLLKLDKNSFKNIGVYYIGYITKKDQYRINNVNPLYLLVHRIDGYIEEEEGSKYLNIASTDSNSQVLEKYEKFWGGIKNWIEKINDGKSGKYGKDYVKIKFNSNDDLPLNKQLKFLSLTIIVRTVDLNKSDRSNECDICHYWYFLHKNFNYEPYLCTGCHDLMQKAMNFNDVAIASIKGSDYRIHFWYMSISDAINFAK